MGNNPWTYIGVIVVIATVAILGLGALVTVLMSVMSKRTVEGTVKAFLKEIEGMLPGKNCGQCGCESCAQYAHAVLNRDLACDKCPYVEEGKPQTLEACADRFWEIAEYTEPPSKKWPWQKLK